jgi:hypothetical protein
MDMTVLITALVAEGAVMGVLGGVIWKEPRPFGLVGDLAATIFTTVMVGLIAWYIVPQMGFSDLVKHLGIIFEPPLSALITLWVLRSARED